MKKILVIEHDAAAAKYATDILQMADYNVMSASDGKTGVEIALKEKPDLVITGTDTPVLDGYGVLHLLHKHPDFHTTPFIFTSEKIEQKDIRRAMSVGADDYILKPFQGIELLDAVECRLRRSDEIQMQHAKQIHHTHEPLECAEDELLAAFVSGRNIDRYSKKQLIYKEGQRPAKIFYLLKGKIKIFKTNDDGKELVVNLYGEGEFFGFLPVLQNSCYQASATTLEFSEIAVIPRKEFEELLKARPCMVKKFFRILAEKIYENENHLIGLAYNSLRKKVAEALLLLKYKYQKPGEEHFRIDISREDLAHVAGTATESLIRTLTDFRGEKLIEISPSGNIILLNEEKLKHLVS